MNRESDISRLLCVGFDGHAVTAPLRELIARGVRTVILFARNYVDRAQLTELCREIKGLVPPDETILICVDHEGGRVQRFLDGFTHIPPMRELGTLGMRGEKALNEATRRARDLGFTMALELGSCGIDLNLAPVLDVDSNPDNPVIGERSFAPDPHVVARLGVAIIDAMQSRGLAACGKHFPGHGDTATDSHFHLPRLPHDLRRLHEVELVPFLAAIKAGVSCIMTAHVMFDALDRDVPATMSRAVIDGLLRRELGFQGVITTDDLEMNAIAVHFGVEHGAVRAAAAGVDLLMCCHTPERQHGVIEALTQAVDSGDLPAARIEQSVGRIRALHQRFARHGDSTV